MSRFSCLCSFVMRWVRFGCRHLRQVIRPSDHLARAKTRRVALTQADLEGVVGKEGRGQLGFDSLKAGEESPTRQAVNGHPFRIYALQEASGDARPLREAPSGLRVAKERNRTQVVVAANQDLIRESLVELLRDSFTTVGQTISVGLASSVTPDVVVGILRDEDVQGGIGRLKVVFPESKLLVLLLTDDLALARTALKGGIQGIVDRSATKTELVECIKQAVAGEFAISPHLARRLARPHGPIAEAGLDRRLHPANGLTKRESEVLQALSEGCSNRAIATRLVISEHTVRAHLRCIMQKLGVANRVQAAALAWQGMSIQGPDSKEGQDGNSRS
jgi:DNA-binding NarL/FixJ family response regulator